MIVAFQKGGAAVKRGAVAVSEAAGCAAICAAAVYLHTAYPLYGGALGILFGAVNDSVWEHAKIFSAAYVGWSLLQLSWLRLPFRRYAVAKCLGLYLLMGLVIGISCIFPETHMRLSVTAVIAVQGLTTFLETADNRLGDCFAPAVMLLLLYYLMFFSFTIFPPKTALFRDPREGGYGVLEALRRYDIGL